MDDSRDPLVIEQEQAAAAEAAHIGGDVADDGVPEEQRPVREAGGGEAEGFEMAEEALIDKAQNFGEPGHNPAPRGFSDEAEPDPSIHGEPDEEDVSEKVRDPRAGTDDDPGEGPGIAAER
jgi:hypothetical protein